MEFVKGHGTENDFVLLPDMDGMLELTEARVRALCDRHRGLGADGVLRVVSTSRALDFDDLDVVDLDSAAWFMDYRNADGSIAEMCGNGVRVFARYLVDAGLALPGEFDVATRAGVRRVVVHPGGMVTVDMGPAWVRDGSAATVNGLAFPGVAVDVGNPHLVCVIDHRAIDIDDLDLSVLPGHDPALFPHGVNVEFVHEPVVGRLRMRVHERGVGETRSCGTGAVAAAAAVAHLAGRPVAHFAVDLAGGCVQITVDAHTTTLTGPAALVARGELDAEWWLSADQ